MRLTLLYLLLGISLVSCAEWDTLWDKAEKKCENIMKMKPFDKTFLLSIAEVPRRAKTNGTNINHELYTSWLELELGESKDKQGVIESVQKCMGGIEKKEKCSTAFEVYECFGKKYFN